MSASDIFAALARHWAETMPHLTPEDLRVLAGAARLIQAGAADDAGDEDARAARGAMLTVTALLAERLPPGHPVSAAISSGTRLAGARAGLRDVAALLSSIHDLTGQPAPAGDDDPETWLLSVPALTGDQVRQAGADPQQAGLIRLSPPGGQQRLPAFQFGTAGRPIPVVVAINSLLGSEDDPFGVADWWLGRNAWLAGVPAELIGHVDDSLLVRAARAELPGE